MSVRWPRHEVDHGGVVGEDAHDPGPVLDFLVDPLQGIRAPDLGPVRPWERGDRQDFDPGGVHQGADLREPAGELVTHSCHVAEPLVPACIPIA
jgi:hypothetical protein